MTFVIQQPLLITSTNQISVNPSADLVDCKGIEIINDSSYAFNLILPGGKQSYMAPQTIKFFEGTDWYGDYIRIFPLVVLSGNWSQLPQKLIILGFRRDEQMPPDGTVQDINKGVVLGTAVTVANMNILQNDGAGAGTTIIETTVAGQTVSNQTVTNDGIWNLGIIIGGVITTFFKSQTAGSILQLGAIGSNTEIMGSLVVDQNSTVTGTSSTTGAATFGSNVNVGGTFSVTGAVTLNNNLTVNGTTSHVGVVNATNMNAAGTMSVTGVATLASNANVGGTMGVTGASTFTGDATFNGAGNGVTVASNAVVTGNITGGTLTSNGNITVASNATVTGNITGGTLTTAGNINATGNVTAGTLTSTGVVVATGNVTGATLTTAGNVNATGNITGGTLTSTGNIVATGNVTGATLTSNGNITAASNATVTGTTTTASIILTGATNKPQIYSDTSGNTNIDVPSGTNIYRLDNAGSIIAMSGKAIGLGNNGTSRNILDTIVSGATFLKSATAIDFQIPSGSTQVSIDSSGNIVLNGMLEAAGSTVSFNGNTSGSGILYQIMAGSGFKLVYIHLSSFNNSGGTNTDVALPVTFAEGSEFFVSNIGQIQAMAGGVAQTFQIITAIAAAGGTNTNQTTLNNYSWAHVGGTTIDTIRFSSGIAGAHSGAIIMLGR